MSEYLCKGITMKKMASILLLLGIMNVQLFADMGIRVGMIKSGDIEVTVEDIDSDYETTYTDDNGEDGWEISLIGGIDKSNGFDFRPVLTFQSVEIEDVSTMSLLCEFEFAYNINRYISPFIGFNGGVGYIDFDSEDISNTARYQFGLFVGVSGEIYSDFGYYAKYEMSRNGWYQGYDDADLLITEALSPMRFGLSYTF